MRTLKTRRLCIGAITSIAMVLTLVAHLNQCTLAQVDIAGRQDGGHITSVAFSPTDNYLAGGSFDGTVKLWNAGMGELHSTLKGHTGYVRTVAFSL